MLGAEKVIAIDRFPERSIRALLVPASTFQKNLTVSTHSGMSVATLRTLSAFGYDLPFGRGPHRVP
jgi:hypothetical protein